MLRELHIHNLAVIEDIKIELSEGLNCFTGQTGAGKSLILGAFEILLGLRASGGAELLRPGAQEARVSGLFELHDKVVARRASEALDQAVAAGDQVLITRKLFASGRSSLSANGQPATAAMVRAVGELIVDIHGQHDQQCLLKPSNQLSILDAFSRCEAQADALAAAHRRLTEMARRRSELAASRMLRRQQLELYEFQAQEIDAAAPVPGEWSELKARHALLSNLQRVKRDAGQVHAALYDAEGSIVERLQAAWHVLENLKEIDPALAGVCEQVKSAALTLQDAAFEVGRYVDRLDLDPGELAEVEERLNVLNRLASKYPGTSAPAPGSAPGSAAGSGHGIASGSSTAYGKAAGAGVDPLKLVLDYRAQLDGQIRDLKAQDEDLAGMDAQIAGTTRELDGIGKELGKLRRAGVGKLRPLVEAQLRELGMGEAEFDVEFTPCRAEEMAGNASANASESGTSGINSGATSGATSGGASGGGGGLSGGMETIEMMIRTNPGQPARPLRKIASGGELSRIMLALKAILAQSDRVSVLVFDEIDANIGGRMGTVIGQKLRALAEGGHHQVLCITHLPQIAAFAHRHLRIAKAIEGKGKSKQTRTTVGLLEGQERISELAEMLAGKEASDTTRRQVREMLASART